MTPAVQSLRRQRLRLGLGFAALVVLVTWLFHQADDVSPEVHHAYLQSLRRVQQADVELNAAVVSSYADLLHNYDPMQQQLRAMRREGRLLAQLPAALPSSHRIRLERAVDRLIDSHQAKADDVDRFQRVHSVLRNSEDYLPRLVDELLSDPAHKASPELLGFTRHLLSFAGSGDDGRSAGLADELAALRRARPGDGANGRLGAVLVHAGVVIERRPQVDQLVRNILMAPSAQRLDELTRLYVEGHEAAQQTATHFRQMLYLVSLLLVAYVIYALVRLARDRRQMALLDAAQQRAEGQIKLYGTVFTNAAEGMVITDAEARILAVNPAFSAITGYALGDVLGHTPAVLNSGRQGKEFYHKMWKDLTEHGTWQGEIWNRRKDGEFYPEWLSVAAVRDEAGKTSHYIGVFTDISERKRNEARIHHLAHHDALTGLPNRLLLEDRIDQAMLGARRNKRSMALIFVDLDRFKNINDTLGHEIGDVLLIEAAQRGLSVLRDTDTLSRLGGDEFVVVLSDIESRQDAMFVARKLLAALCQPYLLAGHELTVSASAGIALYPEDGQNTSELLRKADAAMYRAKDEGRNTFRFFSAEMNTASLGELLLENDLFGALERDELEMHYQPKIDAATGELAGAEALMRWRHREQGMIPPSRFIPLAEENGLIKQFGEWAIESVCAQQRAWLDAGLLVVPVAVNISAQQFSQQDLPQLVAHALADHGLPPQLLELELTESMLMRDSRRATEVLQTLRNMHIHVSIDDFGTGYSSLSYLRQFPAQSVKIDRSFVSEINEDGEAVPLAAAIIAMAHELGLVVIAEGVETGAQHVYLREHACDQLQGFLFGRPVPAAEFSDLLAGRRLEGLGG